MPGCKYRVVDRPALDCVSDSLVEQDEEDDEADENEDVRADDTDCLSSLATTERAPTTAD
jgi:hypothetical protein